MSYTWVTNTAPTAAQLNAGVRDETIALCTYSPDTRPAGSSTGKHCCTTDDGRYWRWNGSAWVWVLGGKATWTPTVAQSGTISFSSSTGEYTMNGDEVSATFSGTVSSSGTVGSPITLTLPVTAAAAISVGQFWIADAGTTYYTGSAVITSTTGMHLCASGNGDWLGSSPSFGLAASDLIRVHLTYRRA